VQPAVAAAPPASAPDAVATADPFTADIAEGSHRFDIPASWIRAVIEAESLGDTRAMSPKGAMGLMQIMPETWTSLRLRYGLGADPFDPHDNILAGAAYLRVTRDGTEARMHGLTRRSGASTHGGGLIASGCSSAPDRNTPKKAPQSLNVAERTAWLGLTRLAYRPRIRTACPMLPFGN
jgi:hypothetical protein